MYPKGRKAIEAETQWVADKLYETFPGCELSLDVTDYDRAAYLNVSTVRGDFTLCLLSFPTEASVRIWPYEEVPDSSVSQDVVAKTLGLLSYQKEEQAAVLEDWIHRIKTVLEEQ